MVDEKKKEAVIEKGNKNKNSLHGSVLRHHAQAHHQPLALVATNHVLEWISQMKCITQQFSTIWIFNAFYFARERA